MKAVGMWCTLIHLALTRMHPAGDPDADDRAGRAPRLGKQQQRHTQGQLRQRRPERPRVAQRYPTEGYY